MKNERDEILYIPRDVFGGFMCPKCLSAAIGKGWDKGANYCPQCGQHIKVIDAKDFEDLKKRAAGIHGESLEHIAEFYMHDIYGIYKSRLDKFTGNENYIAGQMELSDFL